MLFCFLWAYCLLGKFILLSGHFSLQVQALLCCYSASKKAILDSTMPLNFRSISNLSNIFKILERLFLTRLQPYVYIASLPIVSIIYNQLIANISLLKPLSFTSFILSTMQLIMGSSLFSLSTSVLHSTQFSSIVSLPVSASWVPLISGLSPIFPTGLSQSFPVPLPLSYYLHFVVFLKALSYVPSFSQIMSHLFLQLYPLTASINSNVLKIHSFLSASPLICI